MKSSKLWCIIIDLLKIIFFCVKRRSASRSYVCQSRCFMIHCSHQWLKIEKYTYEFDGEIFEGSFLQTPFLLLDQQSMDWGPSLKEEEENTLQSFGLFRCCFPLCVLRVIHLTSIVRHSILLHCRHSFPLLLPRFCFTLPLSTDIVILIRYRLIFFIMPFPDFDLKREREEREGNLILKESARENSRLETFFLSHTSLCLCFPLQSLSSSLIHFGSKIEFPLTFP